MSKGGRGGGGGGGGGRGGRKSGPDMSWQDEDTVESSGPLKRVPGPIFPERYIPTPKSLSTTEKAQVQSLLRIRERIRNGVLFTVLEPSSLLDDHGKVNPRAGFDPFNDQERYTQKYHRKRRTVPDLTTRGGYSLNFFPVELWPVLDPKKRQKDYWDGLSTETKSRLVNAEGTRRSGVKRKRAKLTFNDDDVVDEDQHDRRGRADEKDSGSESDEDTIIDSGRRKKKVTSKTRRNDATQAKGKEKKGLDAEDDYPDVEQQDDDGDDVGVGAGAGGEEEPQDSEFGSDEDDDEGDDYNAEIYFDDGADDDVGDVDDDGGGGGGDYY